MMFCGLGLCGGCLWDFGVLLFVREIVWLVLGLMVRGCSVLLRLVAELFVVAM